MRIQIGRKWWEFWWRGGRGWRAFCATFVLSKHLGHTHFTLCCIAYPRGLHGDRKFLVGDLQMQNPSAFLIMDYNLTLVKFCSLVVMLSGKNN